MDRDANEEGLLRECMYCGTPAVGRSMRQHIVQTVDADHGAFQTIPDGFSIKDCPIITD